MLVVGLQQVVREELVDPEEYEDFVDDVRGEIEDKYGAIRDFHIPKPVCWLFHVSMYCSTLVTVDICASS